MIAFFILPGHQVTQQNSALVEENAATASVVGPLTEAEAETDEGSDDEAEFRRTEDERCHYDTSACESCKCHAGMGFQRRITPFPRNTARTPRFSLTCWIPRSNTVGCAGRRTRSTARLSADLIKLSLRDALLQVAHLDVNTMLAPEIIRMKLNDELPADINVLEVEKTSAKFHARHDAVGRSYLYQISRRRTAFGKRYVWWIKDNLDIRKMVETAGLFAGMKNMQSFTADDPEEKSTKVLIEEITIREEGDLILIRISGSHFLWKMVRQIVGILAEVGRGKLSADRVRHFLSAASDEPAKYTAPPSGLFLEHVYYPGEEQHTELHSMLSIASSFIERTRR